MSNIRAVRIDVQYQLQETEMPNDKPEEGKKTTTQNDAVLRLLQETNVSDRNDYINRRTVLMDSKECMRCHPKRDDYKLPDLRLDGFDLSPRNKRDDFMRAFLKDDPAVREARDTEKFKVENSIDKSVRLASRLPENLSLQLNGKNASVETDFVKLAKVVPGVQMDKTTSEILSTVKSVSVSDTTGSVKFNKEAKIPVGQDIPLLGKVTDVALGSAGELKFQTKIDAKNNSVSLSEIQGMNLKIEGGKDVAIRGLSVDSAAGKPVVKVTIDNPKERPDYISEKLWPKTITVPMPLDKVAPGVDSSALPNVILALADAKQVLQDRDVSRLMGTTGDGGVDGLIKQLSSGLTGVEKHGDQIVISRNNGNAKLDLGGPDITVADRVSLKLKGDGDSVRVSDIDGINITLPLPEALGSRMTTPLREISLGPTYSGSRTLDIKTGKLLEDVRLRVDSNLQPIKDADGNWNVSITMPNLASENFRNEKFTFDLKLDKNNNINMKASDVAAIVSSATWQATDLSINGGANLITSGASKAAEFGLWLFGY
jgi:hypothetical protein